MNEAIKILKGRVDELRARYKDNPQIEYLHHYREAQRCLELVKLQHIRSQQAARQSEGESASASLPH